MKEDGRKNLFGQNVSFWRKSLCFLGFHLWVDYGDGSGRTLCFYCKVRK